jgi:DNA-binding Lrp family transcriptional regulator
MKREFKGVWIPAYVWLHKGLQMEDIKLWGEIDSFDKCWATNTFLSEKMGCSGRTIQRSLQRLLEANLIEYYYVYNNELKQNQRHIKTTNLSKTGQVCHGEGDSNVMGGMTELSFTPTTEISPIVLPSNNSNTKNSKLNNSNTKKQKILFLDCVKLTEDEYQKLIEYFSSEETAKEKIQVLNDYIMSRGKKYLSHYHTILNWDRNDKDKKSTSTQFNPLRTRLKPDGSPFRIMTPEEGQKTYDRITMSPKADFIITDSGKYIGLDWDTLTKFPSAGEIQFPTVKGSTKVKRLPEEEKQAYCRFFSLQRTDLDLSRS